MLLHGLVCWGLYFLAQSKVISGWVLTYDSTQLWWFYNAATREDQTTSIWPDIPLRHIILTLHQTDLFRVLIMPSAWRGSEKYQFLCHWFDSTRVRTHEARIHQFSKTEDGCSTHSAVPFSRSCTSEWRQRYISSPENSSIVNNKIVQADGQQPVTMYLRVIDSVHNYASSLACVMTWSASLELR